MINRIGERWPIILVGLTALSFTGNAWLMWREFHRENFVEMHDVRVLDRRNDYVFQMDVEDESNQRVPFVIRFCPDYKPTEEMQAGVILTMLRYERHDFCSEIAYNNLGYTLRRDENGQPIRFTR